MRILVTGAYGFIGSQIVGTLSAAGHDVVCCVRDVEQAKRHFSNLAIIPCEFTKDLTSNVWLERLKNIDAVINCIGVLQTFSQKSMEAIHYLAPRALIEACIQAKVKKMVQISALGADEGVDTPYAQTKLKFEKYLQTIDYPWVILRPSLVYGSGSYGGTSLFRALASLPFVIPIVGTGKQLFQPIYIEEVAKTAQIVLEKPEIAKKIINVVGPDTISVEELFLMLRRWLAFKPAKVVHVPLPFIRIGAYLGDLIKDIPVNSTSYKMLAYNNIADVKPFINTVGFTPTTMKENLMKHPSSTQDRWHARLFFLSPLLRFTIGILWIMSGIIPLFFIQHQIFDSLFAHVGLTGHLAKIGFYSSTAIDIGLGVATLFNWRIKCIGTLQFLLILFYTIVISIFLPSAWLEPFGTMLKNIPLLVATLIMIVISDPR